MSSLGCSEHSAGPVPPFFLVCQSLVNFEDGWAVFRMLATCRRALDDAWPVANAVRNGKRSLLDAMNYLSTGRILLPGFNPEDILAMALQRLTIWDPPVHRSIRLDNPPAFMQDAFMHGSEGNMQQWIQAHPQYSGLIPVDALRVMNPQQEKSDSLQTLLGLLREGQARFFYSPVVSRPDQPIGEQLLPGPGLVITLRYVGFPVAMCFRYSTHYYVEKVFKPWFISNVVGVSNAP